MARLIFACGCLILLSTSSNLILGQNAEPQAVQTIATGQVVDQDGQSIVADVHLAQLHRDFRAWSYRTDLNGWFEVQGWPAVPVEIRITAEGYTSERLKISAPAPWPPVVVRLKRQAMVTGAVRDRAGLGVADARIHVSEASIKEKLVSQIPIHYVLSDKEGRFMIAVPTGRSFQLRVEKDSCADLRTEYMTLAEGQNLLLAAAIIECK